MQKCVSIYSPKYWGCDLYAPFIRESLTTEAHHPSPYHWWNICLSYSGIWTLDLENLILQPPLRPIHLLCSSILDEWILRCKRCGAFISYKRDQKYARFECFMRNIHKHAPFIPKHQNSCRFSCFLAHWIIFANS